MSLDGRLGWGGLVGVGCWDGFWWCGFERVDGWKWVGVSMILVVGDF